jgi:uncharacterized protein YbjT (DUF2867 family)
MRIAVIGGTGTLGQRLVDQLRSRRHETRVLSRTSPHFPIDLTTGDGLDFALQGCEVVVDASNDTSRHSSQTLVEGSRRLLVAEQFAGVRHHVCVSIVGCDRAPVGYYGVKVSQERVVEEGPIPWSIVRCTQFHEFVATMFDSAARWHLLPLPHALVQPIGCSEAASAIAAVCEGCPILLRATVAGPEIVDVRELARKWIAAERQSVFLVGIPLPGKLGRALREGALTAERPIVKGVLRFEDWLAAKKTAPAAS